VREHRTGLAVGALRQIEGVGEQDQPLAIPGIAQAAAQRLAASGDEALDRQPGGVDVAGADAGQHVGRKRVEPEVVRRGSGHGSSMGRTDPAGWRDSDMAETGLGATSERGIVERSSKLDRVMGASRSAGRSRHAVRDLHRR
jgi:hypothetical protein